MSNITARTKGAEVVARKFRSLADRSGNLRPAWPAVSRRAVEGYRRAFDQEGPGWRPLSDGRIRQRVKQNIPGEHPILNASGKLRAEVMNPDVEEGPDFVEILVSSDVLFFHQVGTKRMPARPIHLREKDGRWMSQEVQIVLLEGYR